MIHRLLLALACVAWLAADACAQVRLSGPLEVVDLWPQVKLLSDKERTLTLEQAVAARDRFVRPGGAYATLGMEKEVAWLRIPYAVGPGGDGTWIFEVDYSLPFPKYVGRNCDL